ncbi:MAG: hypothetical protein ACI3YH_02990 [Eubacteriales bacterium]
MILETTKFTDASESAELYQRLDAECEKAHAHLKDVYFVIANYIRERVAEDPSLVQKLKGKTVGDAYKKIEAEARAIHAKTKGNCVMITPERGLAIVGEYCFGAGAKNSAPAIPAAKPTAAQQLAPAEPKKEEKSEIVDIFDLL